MKSKNKNKNKKEDKPQPKEEKPLQKIDFSQNYIGVHVPILVKVKHFNEVYMIFSEEYKKSIQIKEELSLIKNVPVENIRLYLENKRIIEDDSMNHDQQVKNNSVLYASFKNEKDEWEPFTDLINFKIDSAIEK